PEHRRRAGRGGGQARVLVVVQGAGRVVRGPAAVLIGLGATLAYFVVAPALPEIRSHDGGIIVAGGIGLALVVQCATWPLPARSSSSRRSPRTPCGSTCASRRRSPRCSPGCCWRSS